MKKKVINAALCDARYVKEESLQGYDSISINSATMIAGERAREILNRHPVELNVASMIDVPDGEDVEVKCINGKYEIGKDAVGTRAYLIINGLLTVETGGRDAVKSYLGIVANGKVLAPESCRGTFSNLTVNGETTYYPDGATILKSDAEVDSLFAARAANTLYYCPGTLYFLDVETEAAPFIEKGIRFVAKRIVIIKSLAARLASQFDEKAKIVRVPDGTRYIDGDVELKMNTIKRYGTKLCVDGDVTILEGDALSKLEYLFTDGEVTVDKRLEDDFYEVESVYDELRIVDNKEGYISDRAFVIVGKVLLDTYPTGIKIEDCAKVTVSPELTPGDIMKKIKIEDCAIVHCTKEQEEAVRAIAEDVALIRADEPEEEGKQESDGDVQVINAAEYKL